MGKRKRKRSASEFSVPDDLAEFPETDSDILRQAAAGIWEPFFDGYLAPCWQETVTACRARRIPLSDADDLFQELMVRLLRDGRFQRSVRSAWKNDHPDPTGFVEAN